MRKWEMVRLGDVCDVRDGTHDSPKYTRDGYPLVTSKNVTNGFLDFSNVNYISKEDFDNINRRSKVDLGDIIMPMIGTIGKPIIIRNIDKPFAIKNVALIKFYNSLVYNHYIKYILESPSFFHYNLKSSRGGTQKFLSLNDIRSFYLPLPPIIVQQKIADILDYINVLIEKRKIQINKLDLLVKSQFIEMFGDPVTNPMRWEKKQLSELIIHANNGMSRRGNDDTGNIVLRLVELQDGFINYENPNRINLDEAEKSRYLLHEGDFLFARVNGNPDNVGRCAVFSDIGEPVYHNDHIIRVRYDSNRLNCVFASELLNSPYGKAEMKNKIKTSAGQYTINQAGIGAINVPLLPLPLQNRFADFVRAEDKSKSEMQQGLAKMELLYKSLMQKCFNGEIIN